MYTVFNSINGYDIDAAAFVINISPSLSTAIREDVSANLAACEELTIKFGPLKLILLESGGDNLAANFSSELADYIIYVRERKLGKRDGLFFILIDININTLLKILMAYDACFS